MSAFDPYLNWLGIPVHEQPPNFYRLLGVVLFESNPAVIEQAADRQSLTVGAYQGGPQGELCQRLLSEIAMARFNLLDPQQKASYDSHLQGMLAHRGERAVAAPPPPGYAPPAMPRPAPSQPVYAPQAMQPPRARPLAAFRGGMQVPAAMPVATPVAAPFPVARAVSNGAAPAAPPAIPPAAPQRPMDELESLAAQPSKRRRPTKKKRKADYSKEIMFGGIAAAAGVVLVIIYIAAQGPGKTGFGGIGGDDTNYFPKVVAPKPASEKPKPEKEKKDAAVAASKPKNGELRTPPESTSPRRKTPVVSDDGDIPIKIPANPASQQPNRKDISPPELGGPDDPVMGKPDE